MPARRPQRADCLLITCEHGGNRVPAACAGRFALAGPALASHRGFDAGAAGVARLLARTCDAELIIARTSRLLVDLNRSIGHPSLFSEYTCDLPAECKIRLLETHYVPHRQAVLACVEAAVASGARVLHVASHSFTPVLDGVARKAEIGLLFDPRRAPEAVLCRKWQAALQKRQAGWRVRLNYPYRGTADGLTTSLRQRFPAADYVGVELEVNQALVAAPGFAHVRRVLASTLHAVTRHDGAS